MKSIIRLFSVIIATTFFVVLIGHSNAQPVEVKIQIKRHKHPPSMLVAKAPIELGHAIASISSISEKETILFFRDGVYYEINEKAIRLGALKLRLNNGDKIFIMESGDALKSFKEQHNPISVDLNTLKSLSQVPASN